MTFPITDISIGLLFVFTLVVASVGFTTLAEMCSPFTRGVVKFIRQTVKGTIEEINESIERRRIRRSIIFKKRIETIYERIKLNKEKSYPTTTCQVHKSCRVDDEIYFFFKKKGYIVQVMDTGDHNNRHLGNLHIVH